MMGARFLDQILALLLCLLSSLQRVKISQVIIKCNTLILFIIFLVMIPLSMFIYRLVKRFCCKCREPEENFTRNRQIPPETPTIAPVEMIWVTFLDPPPLYVEFILNPEEPRPPYSLRPEDTAGQMRCTYTSAF